MPKLTLETPVKLVPVITTLVPPAVVPEFGEIPVTAGAGDEPVTVMDKGLVAELLALSVTLNVTSEGPKTAVGVPESTPVGSSDSPPGNVPEVMVQV